MTKKLSLILILLLLSAFSFGIIYGQESEIPLELLQQYLQGENEGEEIPSGVSELLEGFLNGSTDTEANENWSLPFSIWRGLTEEQVGILNEIYNEMTYTGQLLSGWFLPENYEPCSWQGITCDENGNVSGLSFENNGFFAVFPKSILKLKELKQLSMVNTLVRGPLPETLFEDLPKLEKLVLNGNFFSGEMPQIPDNSAYYPLQELTICNNREDDIKKQYLGWENFKEAAQYSINQFDYPNINLEPGIHGQIPDDLNSFASLYKLNLAGNNLEGPVPDSIGYLSISELDLSENNNLEVSQALYDFLQTKINSGYTNINLNGLIILPDPQQEIQAEVTNTPETLIQDESFQPEMQSTIYPEVIETTEVPSEFIITEVLTSEPPVVETEIVSESVPTETPTEIVEEYIPTAEPTQSAPPESRVITVPTEMPKEILPTEVKQDIQPTAVPTQFQAEQPRIIPIIIVVTATPVPPTQIPQWYTATPVPQYYPQVYQPQYPTTAPYTYPQPYYTYPTATPYSNYNPYWIYPTATSVNSYPAYPQYQYPTQIPNNPTQQPTQDIAATLGFTYKLEAMTENNIPMTWRYTGMTEFAITYLDASGNLYPGFAMEWKPASDLCNASVCNASVSVPDDLLKEGKFSLQLRTRDASGKTYVSDAVDMMVSVSEPSTTPTPIPEPAQPKSVFLGFLEWLFGPIIRLFGGK